MMIIAVIAIGVLIYYTFNTNTSTNRGSDRKFDDGSYNKVKQPIDILNERFAKGEIEEAEYLKKKDILNQ